MEHHYRRLARKIYRLLRHPRRRRVSVFHGWIGDRVHDRRLWVPSRHPVVNALATGLFFAMMPPFYPQMITSILICIWKRWNVPVTCVACWISNVLTWVPLIYAQIVFGGWIMGFFGHTHESITWRGLEEALATDESSSFFTRSWDMAIQSYDVLEPYFGPWMLGMFLSAIILSGFGFLIGHGLWRFFGHQVPVEHEVPHRK